MMAQHDQLELAEVIKNYRAVYPEFTSWPDLLQVMLADPGEYRTVMALADELRTHGMFRRPVVLGTYETWAEDAAGVDRLVATVPAVEDGTHRVCAHLLTGISPIHVRHLGAGEVAGDDMFPRNDPREDIIMVTYLDVRVPLPLPVEYATANIEIDTDSLLWDALISVRIDNNHWITSPTSGGMLDGSIMRFQVVWDGEALLVGPTKVQLAIIRQLANWGYAAAIISIRTVLETYDDDGEVHELDASVLNL